MSILNISLWPNHSIAKTCTQEYALAIRIGIVRIFDAIFPIPYSVFPSWEGLGVGSYSLFPSWEGLGVGSYSLCYYNYAPVVETSNSSLKVSHAVIASGLDATPFCIKITPSLKSMMPYSLVLVTRSIMLTKERNR